ncbi:hypothetical protein AB3Y40_00940 [Yoonia sp. R2331]|uniref:hypothetical protein n=1 Tax=Yoonia sp. R2331 TaxID=3237238 RepID=UPI0034E5814B
MPSLILPVGGTDGPQIVALVAIFAALFTLVEYSAASPSIIEFRDAPPFNRLRFTALFVTVLVLSLILRGNEDVGSFSRLVHVLGDRIGASTDFPYSPVRLTVLMMPQGTSLEVLNNIRTAAGISYLISLISITIFIVMLRMKRWPKRNGTFNVWVNLPTFDPTVGGDVVARLNRDSQVNLILGFLLPFIIPAAIKLISLFVTPVSLNDPQTLIWTITAWAFLPASLLMRGVALSRVAQMIYKQRKKAYAKAVAEGMLPA